MKMDQLLHLAVFSVQLFLILCDDCTNMNLNAKLSPVRMILKKRNSTFLLETFKFISIPFIIHIAFEQPDLIKTCGYPSEVHNITTEDGYILEAHRIANPGKQPVILMHGVLDSSMAWVTTGPNQSLGYILFDFGYDVFLLNSRGNDYSTDHLKYRRDGTERERKMYWNFSWHEIGKYDLAATIDYVLKETNYTKIHYVAHSQGTTSFFVLVSERPEYNDKILLMTALAPPVFMAHIENHFFRMLSEHLTVIEVIHFAHEQLRLK